MTRSNQIPDPEKAIPAGPQPPYKHGNHFQKPPAGRSHKTPASDQFLPGCIFFGKKPAASDPIHIRYQVATDFPFLPLPVSPEWDIPPAYQCFQNNESRWWLLSVVVRSREFFPCNFQVQARSVISHRSSL